MISETTIDLESKLKGRTPFERVLNAVSFILDSPNGEYRKVFNYFNRTPEVRKPLTERINPETGLMQEDYFKQRITAELETIQDYQKKHGKLLQNTYVLFDTDNVEKAKQHLKTNTIAGTKLIGTTGGMIAALLPCDLQKAKEIMKEYDATFVPYENETFKQLHALALRAKIANNIHLPNVHKFIDNYLKITG